MKMNSYLLVAGLRIMYQDEVLEAQPTQYYEVPDKFYEDMDIRLGFKEPKEKHAS